MSPIIAQTTPDQRAEPLQDLTQPWRLSERQVLSVWLPQMTTSSDPAEALAQAPYTRRRTKATSAVRPEAHRPAIAQKPLDRLAAWCDRYTPVVAPDGEGGRYQGLFLDITGCGHLFGGDDALVADIIDRLGGRGFTPFIAGAHTAGAAWALARFGRKHRDASLVTRDRLADALAPLPVRALRLAPGAVESLDRVGLRRVGDLLDMPKAPLTRRFGAHVALRLDQALGRADEVLLPYRPEPKLRLRKGFAEPIGHLSDIEAALTQLLDELSRRLGQEDLGARRLELWLHRVDGSVATLSIGASSASRDAQHLLKLFLDKREDISAGFGVELMILAATRLEPLVPEAQALDTGLPGGPQNDHEAHALIDRLGNRLGTNGVLTPALKETHQPEQRSPLKSAFAERNAASKDKGPNASRQPRPLSLLPTPEPIEAMAPLPDHPPAMIRYQGRVHRIVEAQGPERITPDWWQAETDETPISTDALRDYYRLESADGLRFWVFRRGLYRAGDQPAWYLHGFFA